MNDKGKATCISFVHLQSVIICCTNGHFVLISGKIINQSDLYMPSEATDITRVPVIYTVISELQTV